MLGGCLCCADVPWALSSCRLACEQMLHSARPECPLGSAKRSSARSRPRSLMIASFLALVLPPLPRLLNTSSEQQPCRALADNLPLPQLLLITCRTIRPGGLLAYMQGSHEQRGRAGSRALSSCDGMAYDKRLRLLPPHCLHIPPASLTSSVLPLACSRLGSGSGTAPRLHNHRQLV